MAYWPMPNLPGLVNNYYFMAGSSTANNQYVAKVDYNMSSKNRLSATFFDTRYILDIYGNYNTGVCSSSCDPLKEIQPQFALSDTDTVSAQMVNEFRFAFLRENVPWARGGEGKGYPAKLGLNNPGTDTFPNISVGGVISTGLYGGANGGSGFDEVDNAFVYSDTFTWIKGRHILKFGGEFDRWQCD